MKVGDKYYTHTNEEIIKVKLIGINKSSGGIVYTFDNGEECISPSLYYFETKEELINIQLEILEEELNSIRESKKSTLYEIQRLKCLR